ncbi:restriction endonuclease subunit S [Streptomyces sp. NPDC056056]|uniref:restriction endonuclease subunit S n=1 Tax=Streptomyces sp. NPDC056056 TaxID=3345698 RepID=UPI0035DDF163
MRADAEMRLIPVREAGDVRMGKQLSPASREAAGQFPYLRVANVYEGRIDLSDVKSMGFSRAEREVYGVSPGDILLNEGQENLMMVGRSALYQGDPGVYCFQNTLIRFRPGSNVVPEYAQAVFVRWRARGVFAGIAEKTSISHLGGNRFGSLLFPLRPLREQQRIVDIIGAVSAQERAIGTSIAKLKSVMEGALSAILDGFVWDDTLADASDGAIRNGFSPVESEVWTGVQMLGLGCLTSTGFEPAQLKNAPSFVAAEHAAMLRDGDLLMSRANTRQLVGLAGVYRDVGSPCIYPDLMMRIRPSKRCSVDFLAAVLMSPRARRYIRSMAQGTSESMVKISSSAVRRIPVPLPSLEEQARVLATVSSLSRQVDAGIEELAKLQALKLGLVDDLLLGEA